MRDLCGRMAALQTSTSMAPSSASAALHHGLDGGGIRDVGEHGDGAHAGLSALGGDGLELLAD